MAPGAAAGWYPDPLGRHEQRWWDGEAWTSHVADGGVPSEHALAEAAAEAAPSDATPADVPNPGATPPAGVPRAPDWYPDPLGHAQVRWWDGEGWTSHVATGGNRWEDVLTAGPTPVAAPPARPPRPPRPAPSRLGVIGAAALGVLVLGVGLLVGLQLGGGGDDGGDDGPPSALDVLGPGEPAPAVTGFLEFGEPSAPVTETVDSTGATITTPGGTTITVPEGAHPEPVTYSVTERSITGHSFGSLVNPASTLLEVDNGGGYSDEPVELRIPVTAPEGTFAMATFYDDATGRLEPLPILEAGPDHVTAVTRHFSSIFVTYIDLVLLTEGTIDSGFRPGVDSWQFVNYGSYLATGGHCSGQSLSALWYYVEQRRALGEPQLFGRHDNRIDANRRPSTTLLQWDDHDGYRLASMVQRDQYASGLSAYERRMDRLAEARVDALQYHAFAYSILLTGEPQYVGILRTGGGGHAMIVYAVTPTALLVSDPNYPRAHREISWNARTGVLGPYNAQANAAEPAFDFDIIGYYAKSALISWDGLGGRWQEFLDGTIGDGTFPTGPLEVREVDEEGNQRWVPLADGYEVADDTASITMRMNAPTFNERLRVYRWDQALVVGGWDAAVEVPLVKGVNRLGIETWGWRDNRSKWVSFERLNVVRGEADEPPLDLVFVIDLTGSMEDDIDGVKAAATGIVRRVAATSSDWRVAIVGYRDVGDDPMFEDYPFTSDEARVVANINALSVFGGGDEPEAVLEALSRAIDSSTIGGWRDGFPNKQIILMGDAPGHVPGSGGETPESVARAAELADPVVIQSVVVGNFGEFSAEAVSQFEELSRLTFGTAFTAADAEAVPEALEQAIGSIGEAPVPVAPPGDGSDAWRTVLLVVSLVLLVGGAAVLAWRLLRPPPAGVATSAVRP